MPKQAIADPSPEPMPDIRDSVDVVHRQAARVVKRRLGYILDKRDGWTLVALGTSQRPRDDRDYVLVEAHRWQGRALRLSKDTYFHAGMMEWFRDDEVEDRVRAARCLDSVFRKLQAIYLDASRQSKVLPTEPPGKA